MQPNAHTIRAVLFDFDGTLTMPGALDFPGIRQQLGCPPDLPVLEFIQFIEDEHRRRTLMDRLDQIEVLAASRSHPNAGAQEVVRWLKQRQMPLGIITRNSRASVARAMANFDDADAADFDLIITRDDPLSPKPSGEGVLWAAAQMGLQTSEILVVGDFVFDCQAGRAAGARTALLDHGRDPRLQAEACDYRIRHLLELKEIVRPNGTGR